MRIVSYVSAFAGLFSTGVIADNNASSPQPWGYFVNNIIYQPTGIESVVYPRYVELSDGTILATTGLTGHTPAYFPVFESKDGGASWEHVSNLTDQVNGWGMSSQPALAVLTEPMAGYEAGTILGSGNSQSVNGTRIDLYVSKDRARTWEFVSRIAEGGPPASSQNSTPIWEPYLLQYQGQLIAYYSDQRDPKHSQKLSHQTSTDLKTWSSPVNDAAYDDPKARPGMTVVAYLPPLKQWILVYEYSNGTSFHGVNYPVYYALADSPLDFGTANGRPIVVNGTIAPNASPYVVWSSVGGPNGTIIVSDASHSQVFTNSHGGADDMWEEHATPVNPVYARAIQIFAKDPNKLMIYGDEKYGDIGQGSYVQFSATVVRLDGVLAAPAALSS